MTFARGSLSIVRHDVSKPAQRIRRAFAVVVLLAAPAPHAVAQCANGWEAPIEAPNGDVLCVQRGAGSDVWIGGEFSAVGATPASRVARWDGAQWSGLGSGITGSFTDVRAIAVDAGGGVVVGGAFATAGGISAKNVARWSGGGWSALGAGLNGTVEALLSLPDGRVVAGGWFTASGTTSVSRVAVWDGATWSPLGAGADNGVLALAFHPNGDVLAGGLFTHAGGIQTSRIARWDGASWFPLGAGLSGIIGFGGAYVRSISVLSSGDIAVAGGFTTAGGVSAHSVARRDGAAWHPLGNGLGFGFGEAADSIVEMPSGDLIATGGFSYSGPFLAGVELWGIARWKGDAWVPVATPYCFDIESLAVDAEGALWVGGSFSSLSGVPLPYLATMTTTCPASVVEVGSACSASGGLVKLSTTTLPWVGSTYEASASGMTASTLALSVLGWSQISIPASSIFPFGVPGCTLVATPNLVKVAPVASGQATVAISIPPVAPLIGVHVVHQVVAFHLDALGAPFEAAASNGLDLGIGYR